MDTDKLLTMDEAEGRLPFMRAFGRKLVTVEALAEYRTRTPVASRRPCSPLRRPCDKGFPAREG